MGNLKKHGINHLPPRKKLILPLVKADQVTPNLLNVWSDNFIISKFSINLTPIRMFIPNHFCNRRYPLFSF